MLGSSNCLLICLIKREELIFSSLSARVFSSQTFAFFVLIELLALVLLLVVVVAVLIEPSVACKLA